MSITDCQEEFSIDPHRFYDFNELNGENRVL